MPAFLAGFFVGLLVGGFIGMLLTGLLLATREDHQRSHPWH